MVQRSVLCTRPQKEAVATISGRDSFHSKRIFPKTTNKKCLHEPNKNFAPSTKCDFGAKEMTKPRRAATWDPSV
jgi:hypothetical protein